MKKYSPVRIQNPIGNNHVVRLHPTQSFILYLSKDYVGDGKMDVTFTSEFFYLHTVYECEKYYTYTFVQKFDLDEWNKVSTNFLGNVEINCGKSQRWTSLCVLLDSTNELKRDVVCVYNPMGASLKVEPHHIVQVVVADRFGIGDWDCKIVPSTSNPNIVYEQIGYEAVDNSSKNFDFTNDDVDDIFFIFSRSVDERIQREHHFWFRCNSETIEHIGSLSSGEYAAGQILFEGESNKYLKVLNHTLFLEMNIRSKNRHKHYRPRLISTLEETKVNVCNKSVKIPSNITQRFLPPAIQKHHTPVVVSWHKKKNYKLSNNYTGTGTGYSEYSGYTSSYTEPKVRDIKLKLQENITLESGAKWVVWNPKSGRQKFSEDTTKAIVY